MWITQVHMMPKGIAIEVVFNQAGYQLMINNGEPTWFKRETDTSYIGLSKEHDSKLINKLNREWKNIRYYG